MSKIIHLKDYSKKFELPTDYKFIKAYATNSRLMGVVGVRVHYEGLILFFHLDYEEYGFDRFEAYTNTDEETINRITKSFMGGLGAKLVKVTIEQVVKLVYEAIEVGEKYFYDVPTEFYEYEYLFEAIEEDPSMDKVCVKLKNEYDLINYFLMRTTGLDFFIRDHILADKAIDFELSEEPTVLLKNTIIEEDNSYTCQSIIDFEDQYKMIISRIEVENQKIISAKIIDDMLLTSKEASFQLNKKEYILVMFTEDINAFKSILEHDKPGLLKNHYDGGTLYTEFFTHNNHVRQSLYYLNGDVFASYYTTDENHVVISCFTEQDLGDVKCYLREIGNLDLVIELESEKPILYNFIRSGYQDFFDYLGE